MQFKKFKNNNHLHDCLKETIKKYESISMQKFYDEAEKYV